MLRTVPKNVSVETVKIKTEYRHEVKEMFNRYEDCLNYMYDRYGSIKSLDLIQSFRNLRDHIRKDMKSNNYDLCEEFGIAGRHWVMAAFQCSENLKSNWTNLGNRIKKEISNNDNLNEDEKHYIRYIVSVPHYWYCVLNHKSFEPNKTLSDINVDEFRIHCSAGEDGRGAAAQGRGHCAQRRVCAHNAAENPCVHRCLSQAFYPGCRSA